jgi:hypothetical protein
MPDQTLSADLSAKPTGYRLRWELVWAVTLKLAVLLLIKFAFFAHRVPVDVAAHGMAQRLASATFSRGEPASKDQP